MNERKAPPPAASTGPFLSEKLRTLAGCVLEAVPRLQGAADDQAVHDLRVAVRRTRTVLEAGREVFGRFRADEARRSLRDVQRATGALRDEEVLLDLVTSFGLDRADVRAWIEVRRRRERRLRGQLLRAVRSGEIERALRLIDALLAFRVKPSRERRLEKFARRAVLGGQRDVTRLGAPSLEDATALHQLRIAHKRLRYTVETFAEALPESVRALAPVAARYQARLGALHDVDVAIASVRRARALTDPARTALLQALHGARLQRASAFSALGAGASLAPLAHTSGRASLRKTSTR